MDEVWAMYEAHDGEPGNVVQVWESSPERAQRKLNAYRIICDRDDHNTSMAFCILDPDYITLEDFERGADDLNYSQSMVELAFEKFPYSMRR